MSGSAGIASVEHEAQDERADQAENQAHDRRCPAKVVVHRPCREHREEDRIADAQVPGAAHVAPRRQVEAQRVGMVGASANSRDVGPLATDQMSIDAHEHRDGDRDGRCAQPVREQQADGRCEHRLRHVGAGAHAGRVERTGEQTRAEQDQQRAR